MSVKFYKNKSEIAKEVNDELRQKEERKPTQAQIYKEVVQAILGYHNPLSKNPPFSQRFHLLENTAGIYEILEEGREELVFRTTDAALSRAIAQYTNSTCDFTAKQNDEIRNLWKQLVPKLKNQPALIRQKSEPGLCWHRLPFELKTGDLKESCPTFADFIDRCSPNGDAVMAFIGSLFFEETANRQYLWLVGDGQESKSAITRLLVDIFGAAACGLTSVSFDDPFLSANFLNKRLVVCGDVTDRLIAQKGPFKAITGDDYVTINRKFQPQISITLYCSLIFTSNLEPILTSAKADSSRAIVVRVRPHTGDALPKRIYNKRLHEEAPFIIGNCIKKYQELCPDHGYIPADMSEFEKIADTTEIDFIEFVDRNLIIDSAASLPAQRMHDLFISDFRSDRFEGKKYSALLRYLERKYGIRIEVKKVNGKPVRVYRGCRILPATLPERRGF